MAQQHHLNSHPRHLYLVFSLIPLFFPMSSLMSSQSLPCLLGEKSLLGSAARCCFTLADNYLGDGWTERPALHSSFPPSLKSVHTCHPLQNDTRSCLCTNTHTQSFSIKIFYLFIPRVFVPLKPHAQKFIQNTLTHLRTQLQSTSQASWKTSQSAQQQMTVSPMNCPLKAQHMHHLSHCLPLLTRLQNLFIDKPHLKDLRGF